ncbi:MAG TPA: carboxypeptidase-like regulatory domain-containing protein [Bacteroidia bacterium]|nr:carboxypeptidase-like regulatory domain-containing protein [Bacteroidia bacterium]
MKRFYHTLLFALALVTANNAHGAQSMKRYFEMEGKIFGTGFDASGAEKYMDSAMIIVTDMDGNQNDTMFSAESGQYIFRLPLDNEYTVTVMKDGFLSKKIHISTYVPLFTTGYFGMEFEMSLYKSIPGLSISFLDEPVADIRFNHHKKEFDYDRAYSDQVNRNMKKIYYAYYHNQAITVVSMKKPVKKAHSSKGRKSRGVKIYSIP